jgi:hypothetical protein
MTCPSDVSERRTETAKACRACDGTGWKEWAIPDADGDTHGQPCPDCPRSGEAMQVNDEGPTLNSDKPKERNLRSAEAKESKWPCFYCGSYQAFHVAVHAGGTVPACETHKGGEWRRSNEAKDVEHNPRSAESSGSSVLTPDDRPVPGDSRSATPVRATSGDGLPREANQPPGAAVLRFADGARVRVKGGPHTGRLGTVYDNVFGESKVQLDGDSAGHWWDNSLLDELTSEAEMLGLYPLPPMNRCTYVIHDSRGGDRRCTRLSCHTGACDYEPERRMYCSKCSGLTEHAERCPDGAQPGPSWVPVATVDVLGGALVELRGRSGVMYAIESPVNGHRREALVHLRGEMYCRWMYTSELLIRPLERRGESAQYPTEQHVREVLETELAAVYRDRDALDLALTERDAELAALRRVAVAVDRLRFHMAKLDIRTAPGGAFGSYVLLDEALAEWRRTTAGSTPSSGDPGLKISEAEPGGRGTDNPAVVEGCQGKGAGDRPAGGTHGGGERAVDAPSASPLNPRVEPPTDTCGLLLHSGRRCTRARGHLSPSHWSTDPDVTCEHPMHRRQGFPNGIWCCDCGALWLGAETGQPGRWRTPGEGPR